MARIEIIPDDSWDGELGEIHPRVVDPKYGQVDNVLAVHSLNPPLHGGPPGPSRWSATTPTPTASPTA